MAKGDISALYDGTFGATGSRRFVVAAGAAASINPGEPVTKALGGVAVSAMTTSKPVVATDFLAGVSSSTSTDTVAAAGVVDVVLLSPNQVWLIAPKTAASWDTQEEYDALVGSRMTLDLTGGVYTINATDGATNGCVVEPLDITKYPGKVAFSFRAGCSYLS